MVNPIGPQSPVNPPEEPPITLFNPTGLDDDLQQALEENLDGLRQELFLAEPRISINELFAAVVGSLLTLIEALKEADLEGNKNLILSSLDQTDILSQSLANNATNALNEEPEMAILSNEADDVDAAANDVETARDDYNAAVAAYNVDPNPPNDTNLDDAITALNNAIDTYNAEVVQYNAQLQVLNDLRSDAGNPSMADTNGLVPLNPIPEGEKITFPSTDLVPSVVTTPPTITFNENDEIYENLGAVTIDDDYNSSFNTYQLALTNLNNHIDQMNEAAQQPGFDPAVDYPPLADTYNELVDQYNTALAALESDRDNYNNLNLPGGPLTWDEDPQSDIPTSIMTYTPLPNITSTAVNVSWTEAFTTASQDYNSAVAAYNTARDDLNAAIDAINLAYQDPMFVFADDYPTLAGDYNAALADYNAAVADLQDAATQWNELTNHSTLGTIGPPLNFEILPEDPLPLTATVPPPPTSNISLPTILNPALYEVFIVDTPDDLTTAIDDLTTDQNIINNVLESSAERDLLSLIFLARGKATSEIFEPNADGVRQTAPEGTAVGGTLGSILFGLASPRVQSALSSLDVAQTTNFVFNDIDLEAPRGLGQLFQNLTIRGGVNAALASISFALLQAFDLLKTVNPDSFPINLASFVALAQALTAVGANGGFTDLTRQVLGNLENVRALPNDNQEALFQTVGNLSAFALTFAALSDLGSIAGTRPEFALGSLALDISFGSTGSQLDLREALKSIKDTLQGTDLDNFQKDLTDAFTDVLSSGGIAGDASKALALRFAEGLFAADDPNAYIRETLSGQDNAESLGGQIANLALLASFAPQLGGLGGIFSFNEGDPEFEALKQRLSNAGFGEEVANQFLGVPDGSFLNQIANLRGEVDPQAIQIALGTVRDFEIAVNLRSELGADLDPAEAQTLTKATLESILTLDQRKRRILQEFIEQENLEAIQNVADYTRELYKEAEKPELFLPELTNPSKTALRYGSLYWEGTIPGNINMRVGPEQGGSEEIRIQA